jgi:hypothetical protein
MSSITQLVDADIDMVSGGDATATNSGPVGASATGDGSTATAVGASAIDNSITKTFNFNRFPW